MRKKKQIYRYLFGLSPSGTKLFSHDIYISSTTLPNKEKVMLVLRDRGGLYNERCATALETIAQESYDMLENNIDYVIPYIGQYGISHQLRVKILDIIEV